MPRYNKLTFTYADPGTGAQTAQEFNGGEAVFAMAITAAAASTIIKAEMSVDGGTNYVDVKDINGSAVTVTTSGAVDVFFNVTLPNCLFRTNVTGSGGATTTATAWLTSAKDKTNG